jgi:hypothetical protein
MIPFYNKLNYYNIYSNNDLKSKKNKKTLDNWRLGIGPNPKSTVLSLYILSIFFLFFLKIFYQHYLFLFLYPKY